MRNQSHINVREIESTDIELIADYWLNSDSQFLLSLGVDFNKLPTRDGIQKMLTEQINTEISLKKSFALIWELGDIQIGHSNVTDIVYEKHATMHLHLWNSSYRHKGLGTELVKTTLPFYFEKLKLKKLICEPYSLNIAPNKTLEKVGFRFIKKHKTIPGSLNFEQEVNRWELTKENFESYRKPDQFD